MVERKIIYYILESKLKGDKNWSLAWEWGYYQVFEWAVFVMVVERLRNPSFDFRLVTEFHVEVKW